MICLVNALMANASAAAKPAKTKVVEKVIPAADSEDLEREKDEIRQVSAVHILCVKMISVGHYASQTKDSDCVVWSCGTLLSNTKQAPQLYATKLDPYTLF